MNLQCWNKNVAGAFGRAAAATAGIFRQTRRPALFSSRLIMTSPSRLPLLAFCALCAMAFACAGFAQTNYYVTNGTEYAVIGSLPGDQVFPDAAISPAGGFVVWQDNVTDGDGWGISARRLDATLSGTLGTFRVNAIGAGSQENPRVALLQNGGAAFVWQGGTPGLNQHIYARFLTPTNTFITTNDVLVNTFTNNFQINPALAVLTNGNVIVVWASYNQAGSNSMQDVYGRIFSPAGQKIGGEFLITTTTAYNQRNPVVAALANGGFVAGWISEQERSSASAGTNNVTLATVSSPSVDCKARFFNGAGTPVSGEFLVNTDNNPCAMPAVAAAADGGFLFVWGERNAAAPANGWDVYARPFTAAGVGGTVGLVNAYLFGDQFSPRVSAIGQDYLVTWTSLAQDGSGQGVFGRFVHGDGSLTGAEFRVNTTTANNQMQPTVAADGANRFLVVWTSFTGAPNTFDLFAQRYLNAAAVLSAMSAPYVWVPFVTSNNVYQPQLVVSWAPLLGLSVSNYEVYVDGVTNSAAGVVSGNQWTMTATNGLTTNSTHSFQVDYVTTAGVRSPISPSTSGTTWSGLNWHGIPYEWMAEYYGGYVNGKYYANNWPVAGSMPGGSGPTLTQIFLSGGNPYDSTTWLQTQLTRLSQGIYLSWNTQPGATYQVQMTTNLTSWNNVGSARFAAGTTDSIYVGGGTVGYYRVILMRQ